MEEIKYTKRSYRSMLERCYRVKDKYYHLYGGRGIGVCERWRSSFQSFYEDMGPRPLNHSLDRINNDGNYEPLNCRWAESIIQANNRRSNRRITFNGKTQTISEWSRELCLNKSVIRNRLEKGLSVDEALALGKKSTKEIATERFDIDGRNLTMREWAESLNIDFDPLRVYVSRHGINQAIHFYQNGRKTIRDNRCSNCGKMIKKDQPVKKCTKCIDLI